MQKMWFYLQPTLQTMEQLDTIVSSATDIVGGALINRLVEASSSGGDANARLYLYTHRYLPIALPCPRDCVFHDAWPVVGWQTLMHIYVYIDHVQSIYTCIHYLTGISHGFCWERLPNRELFSFSIVSLSVLLQHLFCNFTS